MTPVEAAVLALIGSRDRRLLTALVRQLLGRGTEDDAEALPARERSEPLVAWACRCRSARRAADLPTPVSLVREAESQIAAAARLGVHALALGDAGYPPLVAEIPDPPPMLWARGQMTSIMSPAIAIVGSRAATPYGLAMSARLAGDLAGAGLVIVSGLARGVDSAAHASALAAGGRTVGVLGCGLDRVYPPEHRDLAANMVHAGAIVSEFPPGVPPLQHHFPLRNRIISGLVTAVVVIEAPEKSGALITASTAAAQGRDVLVVPGPAAGGHHRGGHLLIRDGARLVESADDVLDEIGGLLQSVAPIDRRAALGHIPETADFTVDDVAAMAGEPPSTVLARLLDLELAGQIRRVGGGRFMRVAASAPQPPPE